MGMPGRKHYSTATAKGRKHCECESCGKEYFYEVTVTATGVGHSPLWLDNKGSAERAENQVQGLLQHEFAEAVEIVPCPACAWLQANMVARIRRSRFLMSLWITVPLVILTPYLGMAASLWSEQILAATLTVLIIGLFTGWHLSRLYDPNKVLEGQVAEKEIAATAKAIDPVVEAQEREVDPAFARHYDCLRKSMLLALNPQDMNSETLAPAVAIYHRETQLDNAEARIRDEALALQTSCESAWAELAESSHSMARYSRTSMLRAAIYACSSTALPDDATWNRLLRVARELGLFDYEVTNQIDLFLYTIRSCVPEDVAEDTKRILGLRIQLLFPDTGGKVRVM